VALVSVVMPVCDGARFLDEAIGSIFGGEFEDLELVVVDDGSVDATPAILARWAQREPRVRVATLERSVGAAAARNHALAAARGEFVTPHDCDDVYVPARVGPQLDALRADPGAVLVAGDADVIDPRGRRLFTRSLQEPPEVLAHMLAFSNPLTHGAVMYRRDAALALGGYDESIVGSYDYDLWLRLTARGRLLSVPVVCTRYRWHDQQTTRVRGSEQQARSFANSRRALTALLGHEPESDAALHVARETGERVDLAAADRVFREALELAPAAHRRRIEQLTAGRFVAHASRLALARHPLAALACLRYAAGWDARAVAPLTARRIAWLATVRWRERT
jgi:GT2 family glycosyltransferase